MERVISPEERQRRAEEIYYKRKNQGIRVSTTSVNIGKTSKVSLGKKMLLQIIVCIVIYSIFWTIKGNNNVFSQNVINQTKAVLSYDINFPKMYNQCVEYFNSNINNIIKTNNVEDVFNNSGEEQTKNIEDTSENNSDVQNNNENTEIIENTESIENDKNEETDKNTENVESNENTGNSEINNQSESQNIQNDGTQKAKADAANSAQMEIDAQYIKQNFDIKLPIHGTITSQFGEREETEIISAFHQGVDIGAETGTPIYSAMSGTVVASSYAGEYGNHIKIQNGDVLTVYAHCSVLEVNVGDYIRSRTRNCESRSNRQSNSDHICILKLEEMVDMLIQN